MMKRGSTASLLGVVAVLVMVLSTGPSPDSRVAVTGAAQVSEESKEIDKAAEELAIQYLRGNAGALGLEADLNDLKIARSVSSLTAHHVTLQQYVGPYVVIDGKVAVHLSKEDSVLRVMSMYADGPVKQPAGPLLSKEEAVTRALQPLGLDSTQVSAAGELVYAPTKDGLEFAWHVTVETSDPAGSWSLLVKADDGQVLRMLNRVRF